MSQTQTIDLNDSNQVLSKLKPILKNKQGQNISLQTRIDVAGNQIIKGGKHKISFLPISNEQSPNFVTCSKIQLDSESSESDEEVTQNKTTSHVKPLINLKEKKYQNNQTIIVNESKCCIMF